MSDLLKEKIIEYSYGNMGGYAELSAEILFDSCDIVITFTQRGKDDEYLEDRYAFASICLNNEGLVLLNNERHASNWLMRFSHTENSGTSSNKRPDRIKARIQNKKN